MAKYYEGDIYIHIQASDICCDGTLEDFMENVLPDGYNGELMGVEGHIELSYADENEENDEDSYD